MTTFGKILIVLQMALSIIFMAFAGAVYTAQSNWMKKAIVAKQAADKRDQEFRNLQAEGEKERSAATEKIKQLQDNINSTTGELRQKSDELRALTVEYNEVKTALDAQRELAKLNSDEANERIKESSLQREKNSQLFQTRNDVIAELRKIEDKNFALELLRQQLEEKYNTLLKEKATMIAFLSKHKLPTDPKLMQSTTQPPVDVDGLVITSRKAEKGNNEYVEISIGSDDDLRIGHVLTVYNRDKYLGQIKLIRVTPDVSVGLVIEKTPNSLIQKGDNVTTKL